MLQRGQRFVLAATHMALATSPAASEKIFSILMFDVSHYEGSVLGSVLGSEMK
jgi:hypothetical protein